MPARSFRRLSTFAVFALAGVSFAAEPKPSTQPAADATPARALEKPTIDPSPPAGAKLENGKPVGEGWQPLLNGKDLSGLKAEPEFWSIEKDGTLHGFTPGGKKHHYSYTEKSDYGDFEIHADVKLVGNNSGICIRIAPTDFDNVPGYQVDMGTGYWGCLWDEHGRGKIGVYPKELADQILHKDDWNHYYAVAQGHHIQIWLNGVKTIDMIDEKGRLTGPIGFQLCHGGKFTDAAFKNVYVRMLTAAMAK